MIEEQLSTNFNSLSDWFIDNKLSVHFGDEKQSLSYLESNSN